MQHYSRSETQNPVIITGSGSKITYPSSSSSSSWVRNYFPAPKTDTFDGYRNPSFRQQIARGENATTAMTAVTHKFRQKAVGETHLLVYGDRFDTLKRKNYYWWVNNASITSASFEAGEVANQATIDAVNMGFMKKYRETLTAFQGGVFLGELRESLRMLRNPAKALRDGISTYVDRIKKVRWIRGRDPRARSRFVRDSWLEASFGWRPLISDIESGVEALQKMPPYFDQMIRFRGEQVNVPRWTPVSGVYAGTLCKYIEQRIRTFKTFYNLYGKVQVSRPGSSPQWDYWGVNFQDVLPTVWELVPNSFLVDYFANIGDLIEYYSTNWANLKWVSSSESRRFIATYTHVVDIQGTREAYKPSTWPNYPTLIDVYGSQSSYEIETRTVVRTRSASLVAPSLKFKLPGTSTKFLNLAALARLGRSRF